MIPEAENQWRRQYNGQKNRKKGQAMSYNTLHRKLKIEQHEHHYKPGVNVYSSVLRKVWRHQRGNQALNQSRTANTMVNRTSNELQNTTQKTKDWATQTPLKHWSECTCSCLKKSLKTPKGKSKETIQWPKEKEQDKQWPTKHYNDS